MTGLDLERLEALEHEHDGKLGGRDTRPYRELLCYCAGRLLAAGAPFEDVIRYLRDAFAEALVLMNPDAGEADS